MAPAAGSTSPQARPSKAKSGQLQIRILLIDMETPTTSNAPPRSFSPFSPGSKLRRHLLDHPLKSPALRGRDPHQAQAPGVDALFRQPGSELVDAGLGPEVPGHAMAVP